MATGGLPPLRLIHSDRTFRAGRGKLSIEYWRTRSTPEIVASLLRRPHDPAYQEYLKVKYDGTVMQGNTRVRVLAERGYNVNKLPRFPVED